MRQHMARPGLGVDRVQPGRFDLPIHDGGPFAAAVNASKQEVALAGATPRRAARQPRCRSQCGRRVYSGAVPAKLDGIPDRCSRIGFARQRDEPAGSQRSRSF